MPTPEPTPPLPPPATEPASLKLGRELGGDLPCVGCGYNLKGLSIRSMCPECGAAVRAAILAVVDPHARELQPIHFPRLIAAGLIAWSLGATAAALLAWLPHLAEGLRVLGVKGVPRPSVALGEAIALMISAIGSLAFVRPHKELPRWVSAVAVLGVLLYIPLIWATWQQQLLMERLGGPPYLRDMQVPFRVVEYFIWGSGVIAVIILCLRPMSQVLVARSITLRNGRVDRQTMFAMAAAAGLMAFGGAILLLQPNSPEATLAAELSHITGVVVIAIGSLLLTIGLMGSVLDSLRIAQALLVPGPTLKQVIRSGVPAPKTRLGRVLDGRPSTREKSA